MIVRSFTLILVALSLAQANEASQTELDLDGMLKSVCNNKETNLRTAHELQLLTKQLETFVGCSQFHRRSISELNRLINSEDNLELCSQSKADQLLEYYSVFVTNEKYSYPKALRKLFVAYGLRLSAVCRTQMIHLLSRDSHSLLTPDDYEQINQLTGDKSAMAELMSDPKDYDDLVVPKYMIKLLKLQGRATRNEKIYIQTAPTNGTIGRLKAICDRRFKPIYEKLMSPLLSLSSIGFNYKETKKNRVDREADVNKDIYQWYRIVLMCESLANIEILELASADEEGHQLMKVTTREEAAAKVEQARALAEQRYPEYKQLEYELDPKDLVEPSIEDPILDSKNGRLLKAINNFAEPTDQLGSKFYGKLLLFVKDRLKTKNIRVVGSLPDIDKSKQLKKFRDAPTQDLLSLIYEYTQQVHSYRGDKMDKIRKNAWKAFVVFAITIAVAIIVIIMVATLFP